MKKQQGQEPVSPFKEIRLRLGMCQSEFALVLGCSQSKLSQLENGYIALKSLDGLSKLHMDAKEIARLQMRFVRSRRSSLIKKFQNK